MNRGPYPRDTGPAILKLDHNNPNLHTVGPWSALLPDAPITVPKWSRISPCSPSNMTQKPANPTAMDAGFYVFPRYATE
jgi:hypothetical protein